MSLDYPLSVHTHILSCVHVSVQTGVLSIMHELQFTFSNFPAFSVDQFLHTVYINGDGASHNYTVWVFSHFQSLIYWLVFQIQVG